MRTLALILFLGACAHQATPSTLQNVSSAPAVRCPAERIVVELPSDQAVDAVATLVADTQTLTATPTTPSDALSVIQQRIGEFDHHDDRRCQ